MNPLSARGLPRRLTVTDMERRFNFFGPLLVTSPLCLDLTTSNNEAAEGGEAQSSAKRGSLMSKPSTRPSGPRGSLAWWLVCLATTTRFFMDLVVGCPLMRVVFGEDLKLLRSEISIHVAGSVAFFLAGCRHACVTRIYYLRVCGASSTAKHHYCFHSLVPYSVRN